MSRPWSQKMQNIVLEIELAVPLCRGEISYQEIQYWFIDKWIPKDLSILKKFLPGKYNLKKKKIYNINIIIYHFQRVVDKSNTIPTHFQHVVDISNIIPTHFQHVVDKSNPIPTHFQHVVDISNTIQYNSIQYLLILNLLSGESGVPPTKDGTLKGLNALF